ALLCWRPPERPPVPAPPERPPECPPVSTSPKPGLPVLSWAKKYPKFPQENFLGGGEIHHGHLDYLPDPPWHPRLYAPPWLPELPDLPWDHGLYAPPWLPELPDPPWHPGLYAPPWLSELPGGVPPIPSVAPTLPPRCICYGTSRALWEGGVVLEVSWLYLRCL
ncbi:hypothetical protein M9458_016024, partial [Cirrhinus mrigala]